MARPETTSAAMAIQNSGSRALRASGVASVGGAVGAGSGAMPVAAQWRTVRPRFLPAGAAGPFLAAGSPARARVLSRATTRPTRS